MSKYDIYSENTNKIVEHMERFGGSFVQTLAKLFYVADAINKCKIVNTWENYFDDYNHSKSKLKRGSKKVETPPIIDPPPTILKG